MAVVRLQVVVVLSVLGLALLGRMPESAACWITCPPRVVMVVARKRRRRRGHDSSGGRRAGWHHLAPYRARSSAAQCGAVGAVEGQRAGRGRLWLGLAPWGLWVWQCPLELAGYDISQLPMASLCTGLSVIWPTEAAQNHVPKL